MQGTVRGQDSSRVEIWIRPAKQPGVVSRIEGTGNDSEQVGGLRALSASDVSSASTFIYIVAHVCKYSVCT